MASNRSNLAPSIALLCLTACVQACGTETTNPAPISTTWISLATEPDDQTAFDLYIDRDGSYMARAASGPFDLDCSSVVPQCPSGSPLLAAGPRLVGTISAADIDRLEALLSDAKLKLYEADVIEDRPVGVKVVTLRVRGHSDRALGPDNPGQPRWLERFYGTFPATDALSSESGSMLETLLEMQSRYHRSGEPFNDSDGIRAREREWPVP